MTDLWGWRHELMAEYVINDDQDRLAMAYLYDHAMGYKESDPRRMISMFQTGRDRAIALGETWWAYFYDVWMSLGYEEHLGDLQKGLEQAIHCVMEGRKQGLRAHPWRPAAYNSMLSCYIKIDPIGYSAEIEETIAELSDELPPGGNEHRYILMEEQERFLLATGRTAAAKEVAEQNLALSATDPDDADWYRFGPLLHLCRIEAEKHNWEQVHQCALEVVEALALHDTADLPLAESTIWQAVVHHQSGKVQQAQQLVRRATRKVKRLEKPPSRNYYHALCLYYEICNDLNSALTTREEQLEKITATGQYGYECEIHIRRCQLLARLSMLTVTDLEPAIALLSHLKKPESYQLRIDEMKAQL